MELKGSQRKWLRGQAHALKPVLHVGRSGLSESLLENLNEALESHELIKVKFLDFQDQKKQLLEDLQVRARAEVVGTIGHVAILYRRHHDPKKRKIRLPE